MKRLLSVYIQARKMNNLSDHLRSRGSCCPVVVIIFQQQCPSRLRLTRVTELTKHHPAVLLASSPLIAAAGAEASVQ